MARGDSRLGTWQVLLTISMVITPLSAHGESTRVPPCVRVSVCMCVNKNHTCVDMKRKMTNTDVRRLKRGHNLKHLLSAACFKHGSNICYMSPGSF